MSERPDGDEALVKQSIAQRFDELHPPPGKVAMVVVPVEALVKWRNSCPTIRVAIDQLLQEWGE